ncbi:MAG: DNA ligase, partial [Tenericutes bacterium HGW-Tenericutes-8]
MTDIKRRMTELEEQINQANYLYHTLDTPSITDRAYDLLVKELTELELEYPELKSATSPTHKVGGVVLDKFDKVVH